MAPPGMEKPPAGALRYRPAIRVRTLSPLLYEYACGG